VHDPVALERFQKEYPDLAVVGCEKAEEVADDADALVLVTEWQQYLELDWEALASRMRCRIVLDGRNALDRARLTRFGFRYLGIAG
jgi:UDPglucose 6-dehydrogenase